MCNREKDQKIIKRMYHDKLLKTVSDKLWVVKNLPRLAHILNHDSYTDNNTKPCLILKEQTVNQTKAEGNAFFCGFSANCVAGQEYTDVRHCTTPVQGCFLLEKRKMGSYSRLICIHLSGLCTIHTYGWPDLSVSFFCLIQLQRLSPPPCLSLLILLQNFSPPCKGTFHFSLLFAFWWGDTRHIVESSHPGGMLIEENCESVRQGARKRLKRCRETETGWDKDGEVKKRDSHQKK